MRGPPKRSLSFWALGDARQEASCHGHWAPAVPGPRLESLRVSRSVRFVAGRRGDVGLLFKMKSAQGMFRIDSVGGHVWLDLRARGFILVGVRDMNQR